MKFLPLLLLAPLWAAAAEPLIPTADGTTWNYQMTLERPSTEIDLQQPNDKETFAVSYRLAGTGEIDNIDYLQMEMERGGSIASIDFIRQEENGVVCAARRDGSGALVRFDPPQTLIATPLETGTAWKFNGKIGPSQVAQQYRVAGEEEIQVPAGKFRAWHIHCDQTAPNEATIDRWLVPGTGFVKIQTEIKSPSGSLLQRSLLELKELPKGVAQPATSVAAPGGKLTVGVSNGPRGDLVTVFKSAAPAIYARWQGHGLPQKADIRAVFIAENVADVTADYEIDDSQSVAPSPNAHGVFTLTKPEGGWTPGDYRIEFFVNDNPAGTVKLKITK